MLRIRNVCLLAIQGPALMAHRVPIDTGIAMISTK